MNESGIEARGISKKFTRFKGHGHALHEAIERAAFPRAAPDARDATNSVAWALREVSFSVRHGECVGLIGHNGAGKSVLLRILARITRPTSGEARLVGRVGAVLEVGAGFNRELTVRENVFLNGAILGMKKSEIAHKFDDIIAFSEMGVIVDQPLKVCSSGMNVRLAFAIAAQLEPEILLMDEVLAVADADYVRACLARLRVLAHEGRTILLVGHDLDMIAALCPRVLWLEHGRLIADGEASAVIAEYRARVAASGHA